MGAKNGNSAFQRMMEWVLAPFDFAWPFVDDVIIASDGESPEEIIENHTKHVKAVLERFRELNLVCDLSKAHYLNRRLSFVTISCAVDAEDLLGQVPFPEKMAKTDECDSVAGLLRLCKLVCGVC